MSTFTSKVNTNLELMNRCYLNSPAPTASYEWHLNDEHSAVLKKAEQFRLQKKRIYAERYWLIAFLLRLKNILHDSIYTFQKGYLNDLDKPKQSKAWENIQSDLKIASETNKPEYVLRAYTRPTSLSSSINNDMAQITYHELTLYCTSLNCHVLSRKQDGIQAFATILFHPSLKKYKCKGDIEVYRGAVVTNESVLVGYEENSILITTTFLSTSKDRLVANMYSETDPDNRNQLSLLCTYQLHNYRRTALDIHELSKCPDDEEVLIYPYVPFRITKLERITQPNERRRFEVTLEELLDDRAATNNQSEQAVVSIV